MNNKTGKSYCYICKTETNHSLVYSVADTIEIDVYFPDKDKVNIDRVNKTCVIDRWIVKCLGCSKHHFVITQYINDRIEKYAIPSKNLETNENIFYMEKDFIEVYSEVKVAHEKNLYILASIGIRTLIDIIMIELVGNNGGFEKRLKKMLTGQHITPLQFNSLKVLIDSGNASAHRGFKPDKYIIELLLEIVNNLIQMRAHTNKTNKIKKIIPKRK